MHKGICHCGLRIYLCLFIYIVLMKSYCDLPHSLLSNLVRNIAIFVFQLESSNINASWGTGGNTPLFEAD